MLCPRRIFHSALLLTGCLLPMLARAQSKPTEAHAQPSVRRRACPVGERNALSEIGCELARELGSLDPGLVAIAPIDTPRPLERSEELNQRIAVVITGQLGSGFTAHPNSVSLGAARALTERRAPLVYLTPELDGGTLRVTADVYMQARRFWDRVKNPPGGPLAHAYAERPADAEIRSFFSRAPLVITKRDAVETPDASAVALACGDTNGDGAAELVVVGRRRITVGRIAAGQFRAEALAEWSDLSPIARTPLRAPLASARVGDGFIDVGSSDREHLVRLKPDLTLVEKTKRALPWSGGGCSAVEATGTALRLRSCFDERPPLSVTQEGVADAFASAHIIDARGVAHEVSFARVDERALLTDSTGLRAEVPQVGAQLAIGDLDGDGLPEVIASRPTFEPGEDGLTIDTWHVDRALERRAELPLSSVRALAVCPWMGEGLAPIVAATDDKIWILR